MTSNAAPGGSSEDKAPKESPPEKPEAKADLQGSAEEKAATASKDEKKPEEAEREKPSAPNIHTSESAISQSLTDRDWRLLMRRIRAGKCTPFLGAGASYGHVPLGAEIARSWADEFDYPLEDRSDLARVAQFLAIEFDPMFPKDEMIEHWFEDLKTPDFTKPNDPHGMLADLPLPIYLTTNYDNFMVEALKAEGKKAYQEFCRWSNVLKEAPGIFDNAYEPDPENPVVFHLHGHTNIPESLVLTEDDYLDFLVNISNDRDLLPLRIQRALSGSSLLFIGYRLADWSFRVLFRGLVTSTESSLRRISVTVQLPPPRKNDGPAADLQQKYLTKYFGSKDIRVYWGTATEFAEELRARWREFDGD